MVNHNYDPLALQVLTGLILQFDRCERDNILQVNLLVSVHQIGQIVGNKFGGLDGVLGEICFDKFFRARNLFFIKKKDQVSS